MKLQYSGAYNPLLIIRGNNNEEACSEIEHIKANRMPIGIFLKEKKSFTNHEITINKNDKIYFKYEQE